ncbi:MAG: hypothetical protein ACKOHG_13700 [Planctomycetia bacterium]
MSKASFLWARLPRMFRISSRCTRLVRGGVIALLVAGVTLSVARAEPVEALPLPPLPPSESVPVAESVPPAGVIVDELVEMTALQSGERRGPRDAKESGKEACGEEAKECREALKMLRDDRLDTIELDIRVGGRPGSDYPCECRLEGETFEPRRFATTMMTWKAAGYCHKPLYFEDWSLERYGHSYGALDPVLSAAHFFVTLPVLPYKMGVELPWECVYPLGYYRPGSCAPWTVPAVPISCRGFAVEAATVTGLVFLLP